MASIALALERRTEDRLLADIVAAGHDVVTRANTATELAAVVAERHVDAVLVSATKRQLTDGLISACDTHAVRMVALAASDAERRHAATLGLYEVMDADADWSQIETLLSAGVTLPARVPRASTAGQGAVIAVWGPAGAPGRTTLAVNIAAEIAARGHTVALADVDTYSASIAPALGILDEAPGFAAACRLTGTDSLTTRELERVAARYSSPKGAFWVLTGIGRPSRWPELSADRVGKTIEAAREWVDYVVLDTGFSVESDEEITSDLFAPRRNAATLAALRAADRVVAVGLADPVGIARFLRAHVELLDAIDDAKVSTVINRVRSSAIGLNPFAQVSSTLSRFGGINGPALVPHDQNSFDAAVLTGQTLRDAAPKSPARASIARFVDGTLLPTPAATARPRRTRRKSASVVAA